MPFVKTNRPFPVVRNDTDSIRRWDKHTSDNFDLLNSSMALVSFTARHGEETPILNPFRDKGPPIGFRVIDTGGLPVAGHTMNVARLTQDNRIGMTVNFALPVGEQIEVARTSLSSNYTTGVEADVVYSGICTGNSLDAADVFSFDGTSTITVLQPGGYLVCPQFSFTSNATGRRNGIVRVNGNEVAEDSRLACPGGSQTVFQVPLPISLAANDAILCRARQDSGGNLTLVGGGTLTSALNNRTRLTVTRTRNDSIYTATITGILYGPNTNIIDVNG